VPSSRRSSGKRARSVAPALVVETGVRQQEAIALYEHAGFSRIPAFGQYVHSPLSVCMAKDLGM
jgi:CBS domain containing-hemolysin-like protein